MPFLFFEEFIKFNREGGGGWLRLASSRAAFTKLRRVLSREAPATSAADRSFTLMLAYIYGAVMAL